MTEDVCDKFEKALRATKSKETKNNGVTAKYSVDDTSDNTRPKNQEEARKRQQAIEMFNDGADPDKVYRETGWHYNELGKLEIDRDSEAITKQKGRIGKKEEAKLRARRSSTGARAG